MINKLPLRLHASSKAVITRLLSLGPDRVSHVLKRIAQMDEATAALTYQQVLNDYAGRHRTIENVFSEHCDKITREDTDTVKSFSETKKLLAGAMFTMEYSIKAAALFNPSIVFHPDQSGLQENEKRFIMSLRAVGEGHISSIIFQTGILDNNGGVRLDDEPAYFTRIVPTGGVAEDGSYEIQSAPEIPLNEKVLFPVTALESMGMEDARFVQFTDKGITIYYATYTAYDGKQIQTRLLETKDFQTFRVRSLKGAAIQDKGMALFPEKVAGKYVMVSRQGGEMINIMYSENLLLWERFDTLLEPAFPWEMVQLGNCGSPVKTDKGWLLLIHGVGPVRTYVISAILLDLQEPSQVIARLERPLIVATGEDREGYVPNVVYTCGLVLHEDTLFIPYAVSDSASAFATVKLDELMDKMNFKKD